MSERDEYIPSMNVSNTAPPRVCERCQKELHGVFYVNHKNMVLCARCRP